MFMITIIVLLAVSFMLVFYTMVGYPMILLLLGKFKKNKVENYDKDYLPSVSYMIVAHNEEKVIKEKLENAILLNYPTDKFEIIVASDFCTDNTNSIVKKFIEDHKDYSIYLYVTKEHKGKTNAQNEAKKIAKNEILVMTDANSMFEKNAIRELVAPFSNKDIAYTCGKLVYVNDDDNDTSASESLYWKLELKMRKIESDYQTITAGNGSIYAVRTNDYYDIKLIDCHDSAFPYDFSLRKKRAIYCENAISYEKAGENNSDEFKRKVRMNRTILNIFKDMWRPFNIFKYKWFSFFYFGHRTCRYLLWLNHLIFFICSILSIFYINIYFGAVLSALQVIALILGVLSIRFELKPKLIRIAGYYFMTVLAQYKAVIRQMFGKSKPTWSKAESTR